MMRLNPDCIRDILLTVEEHTDLGTFIMIEEESFAEFQLLAEYPRKVLQYHIKQCEIAGLVVKVSWHLDGTCVVGYLTPSGHGFLENVRADTNWEKTKSIAKDIGSGSLQVLTQVASSIISSLISKKLGL